MICPSRIVFKDQLSVIKLNYFFKTTAKGARQLPGINIPLAAVKYIYFNYITFFKLFQGIS